MGNPAYMVADIVAVGLALWFVYSTTETPAGKPSAQPIPSQVTASSSSSGSGMWGIVFLAVVVYGGYGLFERDSRSISPSQASQTTPPHLPAPPPSLPSKSPSGPTSPSAPLLNSGRPTLPYAETLKLIEAKYPVLNPDHPGYRQDLTEQVLRRMTEYKQHGDSPTRALLLAIEDMERGTPPVSAQRQISINPPVADSPKPAAKPRQHRPTRTCVFKGVMSDDDYRACGLKPPGDQQLAVTVPPAPPEPYVFDKGGHPGFPPNCRWLSGYEWSCK